MQPDVESLLVTDSFFEHRRPLPRQGFRDFFPMSCDSSREIKEFCDEECLLAQVKFGTQVF